MRGARTHFVERGGELVHLVLRTVSCVWFDERERQDSPAYQIDCLCPPLTSYNAPTSFIA